MTAANQDDTSISDAALLWRRIPPWHFIYDQNSQRWRPSSAAFADDPDGGPMSVVLADAILAAGRTAVSVLTGHDGYGLVAVPVSLVRECSQGVVRDPLPQEPAHAFVFGPKPKSVQKRLAREAVWVIPPPS